MSKLLTTEVSSRRANLILAVLLLTYLMSYVDRTALGVLQESIKRELLLSDWQLGILSGPAFAVLYAVAGVPIARLAERYSRSGIIAASLCVWSAATMACGASGTYLYLLLSRIGVGIGEAGGTPAAHSLISDVFPANRRARAIGIYSFGVPAGAFLGASIAGWTAQSIGWRNTFYVLGPPGFLLALLVILIIPKIQRGRLDAQPIEPEHPTFGRVLSRLFGNWTFAHLAFGASLIVLTAAAITSFLVPFFVRRYGVTMGEVGAISGVVNGFGAGFGTLLGGFLADRIGARDKRYYAWLPAIALIVATTAFVGGFASSNLWLSVPALTLGMTGVFIYIAPTLAQVHHMVDARMRATAISVFYLVINLIGMGVGPPLAGWLSDTFGAQAFARYASGQDFVQCAAEAAKQPAAIVDACAKASAQGITTSLVTVSCILLWAALHFWLAGRTIGARGSE